MTAYHKAFVFCMGATCTFLFLINVFFIFGFIKTPRVKTSYGEWFHYDALCRHGRTGSYDRLKCVEIKVRAR